MRDINNNLPVIYMHIILEAVDRYKYYIICK